jgi:hypothetical protein
MRVFIAMVAVLVAVPVVAHAQYESYEEYQAAVEREAARDLAYQQREEMLDLQRKEVQAQQQMADEMYNMRQDQYWRDSEDREERKKRERRRWLESLP